MDHHNGLCSKKAPENVGVRGRKKNPIQAGLQPAFSGLAIQNPIPAQTLGRKLKQTKLKPRLDWNFNWRPFRLMFNILGIMCFPFKLGTWFNCQLRLASLARNTKGVNGTNMLSSSTTLLWINVIWKPIGPWKEAYIYLHPRASRLITSHKLNLITSSNKKGNKTESLCTCI